MLTVSKHDSSHLPSGSLNLCRPRDLSEWNVLTSLSVEAPLLAVLSLSSSLSPQSISSLYFFSSEFSSEFSLCDLWRLLKGYVTVIRFLYMNLSLWLVQLLILLMIGMSKFDCTQNKNTPWHFVFIKSTIVFLYQVSSNKVK